MLIKKLQIYIERGIPQHPSLRNVRTVLNNLINAPEFGWTEDHFRKDLFERRIFNMYRRYLNTNNRVWNYSYNTYIKKLRTAVIYCLENDIPDHDDTKDMTFDETLEYLIRKFHAKELNEYLNTRRNGPKSINSFINKKLGHGPSRRWFLKNSPRYKTAIYLEKSLSLPVGSLTSKVERNVVRKTKAPPTKAPPRRVYTVTVPPKIEQEIEDFLNWKQDGILPDSAPLDFAIDWDIEGGNSWTENRNGRASSKRSMRKTLNTFVKFALQAKYENKLPDLEDEFTSLSDILFNRSLIRARVNDCKLNSRGSYSLKTVLTLIAGNSKWEEGYLTAYHFKDADEEKCKKYVKYLKNLVTKSLSPEQNSKQLSVGGTININWFIEKDYDYILSVYKNVLKWLLQQAKACNNSKVISYYETALWMYIGFQFPLRIDNFKSLTIGKSGDAYINIDDKYIYIDVEHFKNRKSLKRRGIKNVKQKVDIPSWFSSYLEARQQYNPETLHENMPLFIRKSMYGLMTAYTATALAELSDRFGENRPGWNPHSIRHIAASLYLRKNRNDWDGLANLLRDDYMTVRNEYAHLSQEEETKNLEDKLKIQMKDLHSVE